MKTLSEHIREVATEEIGTKEIGYTNTGERVGQYQAATSLGGTGWPWCAAFICFVVREAMARWEKEHGSKLTFARPKTAAAYGFDEWSLTQDCSTKTRRSHTGEAIGIFSLHSTSHCGIGSKRHILTTLHEPLRHRYFSTDKGWQFSDNRRQHKRQRLTRWRMRHDKN